jgi:arsenate reductase
MITIYHNSRCQKSRQGLNFLENLEEKFQIINYIKNPLSKVEIKKLLLKLQYQPIDLIRRKEKIWIENFKEKNLSDEEIMELMIQFPKLIERPIVVYKNKAVIARPTEKIMDLF